mmetsp:Transcript_8619/g.14559  ORF Transcript_8619/g.14559 Transcript_8619/m.14559 type:complete len:299 (-) Transcript_8619:305-1201(-)
MQRIRRSPHTTNASTTLVSFDIHFEVHIGVLTVVFSALVVPKTTTIAPAFLPAVSTDRTAYFTVSNLGIRGALVRVFVLVQIGAKLTAISVRARGVQKLCFSGSIAIPVKQKLLDTVGIPQMCVMLSISVVFLVLRACWCDSAVCVIIGTGYIHRTAWAMPGARKFNDFAPATSAIVARSTLKASIVVVVVNAVVMQSTLGRSNAGDTRFASTATNGETSRRKERQRQSKCATQGHRTAEARRARWRRWSWVDIVGAVGAALRGKERTLQNSFLASRTLTRGRVGTRAGQRYRRLYLF